MANRTLDTPYNTMSPQEWISAWSEMLTPGTYERGIFGDLMLPGIACGTRKFLLIFNTNLNSPHDPIYVVNPLEFNVAPDTEIPVVLSYNMTHYESMEPCSEEDINATVSLMKQYMEGRYTYTRSDIPFLISPIREDKITPAKTLPRKKTQKTVEAQRKENPKKKMNDEARNHSITDSISNIDIGGTDNHSSKESKENITATNDTDDLEEPYGVKRPKYKKKNETENAQKCSAIKQNSKHDTYIDNLCYRLRDTNKEFLIKEVDNKMECPFCKILVKNVKLHFEKKLECGNRIDKDHLSTKFEQYQKMNLRKQNQMRQQKFKEKDQEKYKKAQEQARKKRKEEDPEKYKAAYDEANKRKREDPEKHKKDQEEARKKRLKEKPD